MYSIQGTEPVQPATSSLCSHKKNIPIKFCTKRRLWISRVSRLLGPSPELILMAHKKHACGSRNSTKRSLNHVWPLKTQIGLLYANQCLVEYATANLKRCQSKLLNKYETILHAVLRLGA